MVCPFKQNIFVCGGGMTAPVLDSGICGLWRTPCYHLAAIVASKQCLLVKENRATQDSGNKTTKGETREWLLRN